MPVRAALRMPSSDPTVLRARARALGLRGVETAVDWLLAMPDNVTKALSTPGFGMGTDVYTAPVGGLPAGAERR